MRKRRVALTGPCSRPMAVLHMSVMPQRSMRQPSVRMFVSSGTWEIEEEERKVNRVVEHKCGEEYEEKRGKGL